MSREMLTNATKKTFRVDLAVSPIGQDTVVDLGSGTDDIVKASAGGRSIGVTISDNTPNPDNTDAYTTVALYGPTKIMRTSVDIARGAYVVAAANGLVSSVTIDQTAPATVVYGVGIALESSTAGTDGNTQEIEIMMLGGFFPV